MNVAEEYEKNDGLLGWYRCSIWKANPLDRGWISFCSSSSVSNAWPDRNLSEEADPKLQAELYRFLLNEIANRPSIEGVFFWKYFTNSETDEEGPTGFSPLGKPTEEVMSSFFAKTGK